MIGNMNKRSAIHVAIVVIIAVFLFIVPPLWHWVGLPFVIIGGLLLVTIIMVRWHSRHTGYRCRNCGGVFMVSAWTDFLSPHLSDRKMLRCPHCHSSGWCEETDPVAVPQPPASPVAAASTEGSPQNLYWQIILVILLYGALWVTALYQWSALSTTVSFWQVFKIPIATAILPALHFVFCYFAIRQSYRSRIYALVTIFIAVFLLLAVWMQLRHLPPAI